MKIIDEAIVLSINTYSENSKIVRCLTKSHGIFCGFVTNSSFKSSKIIEGALINFNWKARLEEHIGTLKFELIRSLAQNFLFDKKKATSVSCLFGITISSFAEREYVPGLFDIICNYLEYISHNDFDFKIYVSKEMELLKLAGYGLNLNKCGSSGSTESLIYVSPKTGCAISKNVGEEYRHKLLPMPNWEMLSKKDKIDALNLTGYFFERYIYKNTRNKLPYSRMILVET